MTDVKEAVQRALEDARTIFAMDNPFINFVVGILVAYVVIYFITFYLGPILFGFRPYHPPGWPFFARTMHHVSRRAVGRYLDMDGESGADLTAKVTSLIQDKNNGKYD